MFVLGNILFAVARVLDTLLTLYFWVVIISALLTWVRPDPYNPCLLYTSPSPRDRQKSRMPSSA